MTGRDRDNQHVVCHTPARCRRVLRTVLDNTMKTTTYKDATGVGALTFVEEDYGICVVMLSVKRGHRMQGIAGELLARLCAYADTSRLTVHLSVVALDHGADCLPFGLLREWYMRRGFRDQSGPDGYSEHLYRLPRRPQPVGSK